MGYNGCKVRSVSSGHCVQVVNGSRSTGRSVCGDGGGGNEGRTRGRRNATFEFVVVVHDGGARLFYVYSTNMFKSKEQPME